MTTTTKIDSISAMRTQIQIDASKELRAALRVEAMKKGESLREAILKAMAERFPDVKPLVDKELKK